MVVLKTKEKIFMLIIAIVIAVIAVSAIWYFSPKAFLSGVEPSDVSSISVFDGQTGNSFVIDDLAEIRYIVENIQGVEMTRDKVSLGHMGYAFRMSFYNSNGKEIDSFVINSADTIRDDPFFYRCNGGLCYDYLKELETTACADENNGDPDSYIEQDSLSLNDRGAELLNMTDKELIDWLKEHDVEIPNDYEDELAWTEFARNIMESVVNNQDVSMAYSYYKTLEFADAITNAVREYLK